MNNTTGISVVIIAGGRSSRMGSDKRTLHLGGKSLAQRTLRLAQQLSDDIVVSSNDRLTAFEGYLVVPDRIPGGGPVEGLITALSSIRYPAAVALSVDMPFVTPDLVKRLLDVHLPNEVTFFTNESQMHPFPAIYPAQHVEAIKHAYAHNITSMKGLLNLLPSRSVPYISKRDPDPFLNINRREDLEKAKK
jgi:molybdopterin-guanine dinucleotide biosynthesis protein A